MDNTAWVERAKRRLGYPVVSISTPDESIQSFIAEAVERVQPYVRDTVYIEGTAPVVNLEGMNVLSIRRVLPSRNTFATPTTGGEIDPFFTVNLYPQARTQQRLVSIATMNLYRTEMEALIPKDWEFRDNKLYLSGFSGNVVAECITKEVLNKLPQVYQSWMFDYSVALLKISEGEIRSKIRVPNSPVETNGSELKSEGLAEKKGLEEKLGRELSSFFATR